METGAPEPKPEISKAKFDKPIDEVLYVMAREGLANATAGEVESLTGRFSRITNEPADLHELSQAFADEITTAGLSDINELVGSWIVVEAEDNLVLVVPYASEAHVKRAYERMEKMYTTWQAGVES